MSCSRWRSLSGAASLALAAVLSLSSSTADAQACCAGAGMLSGLRLEETERAAAALTLTSAFVAGQFERSAGWKRTPAGTLEVDLEQALSLLFRVHSSGQLGLVVPFAETVRQVPGASDIGGGLGDLRLSYRWEPLVAGEHAWLPGLSVTLGGSLPTGRAPEGATHLLAADATGLGSAMGRCSVAAEQSFGPWLVQLSGALAWQAPRQVGGVEQRFGPQLSASLAAGYAFTNGWGIALVAASRWDAASTIDDQPEPASERLLATLGLSGGGRIAGPWRLQASLTIPVAGRSIPGAPQVTAGLVRSLW